MPDFSFLQDPISHKWISLSPRRAKRPNSEEEHKLPPFCPFCPGNEKEDPSVYTVKSQITNHKSQNNPTQNLDLSLDPEIGIEGELGAWDLDSDWLVRVIKNKFPFAPIHEVIISSPDHHKGFGELPVSQIELILQTYKQRYNTHKDKGQVYIFTNRGELAGESLPHPHSQLAVVPSHVPLEIPEYQISDSMFLDAGLFRIGCPDVSQWPDEVWFVPNATGKTFGEITDEEIASLADNLDRLIKIYDHRYGHEFPFNFYIRPGLDWYLRLIPRVKTLGGFEVGTGVFVNTQDPKDTVAFLKEHLQNPDFEKIKKEHQADYKRHV